MKLARQLATALRFAGMVCRAASEYRSLGVNSNDARALWLHRWSREALRTLRVEVQARGSLPARGVLVSNHLSYLDVLVLAAIAPTTFVSKREVASWPVVGRLTRMAGTIFLHRESRKDACAVNACVADRLYRGELVIFFPEGTSSDGSAVLPFHSALFESAIAAAVPVQAARIRYEASNADPATDVCYWGAMTFASHVWRLFGIERTQAYVQFAAPALYSDRKIAARASREAVLALSASV